MHLLGCTPVNTRLCAVWLKDFARINNSLLERRLVFVSMYASTNCISPEFKNNFYQEFSRLLCIVRSMDVVIVSGDFNAQIG